MLKVRSINGTLIGMLLCHNQMDILWKLKKALREQSNAAPNEHNKAKRAARVRRRNLPDTHFIQKFHEDPVPRGG